MMIHWSTRRLPGLLCLSLVSSACAVTSDGANAGSQGDHAGIEPAVVSEAVCTDIPTNACDLGTWPDGVIKYAFASDFMYASDVRSAMDSWEEASAHVIEFVEDTSATAKATIHNCLPGKGESYGYDGCRAAGCESYMCPGNIYHELGHLIGLPHQHARFDRNFYTQINICDGNNQLLCSTQYDNTSDYGPFNYDSTMLYGPTDPDIARWDGTPICAVVDPSNRQCLDGLGGPMGLPKPLDGAAVVEHYSRGNGWSKFVRTLDTTPPTSSSAYAPLLDDLGGGVTIASDASPAIETWGGDSIAIYIRGTDGNIYKKFWGDGQWSGWELIGTPGASGAVSDPGVVSWASGRTDLVVAQGNEVFISSSPDLGSWTSLGTPAPGVGSAPSITSWGPDHLDVFIRASDDSVFHKSCQGDCVNGWTDWTQLGTATIRGKPAPVTRGEGRIDVFAHGMDDELWQVTFADGWGDWWKTSANAILGNSGCLDCGSPVAGSRDGNSIDVYVRGTDDKVWLLTLDGDSWWGGPLGGVTYVSPATVTRGRSDGRADVIVTMEEEVTSGNYYPSTWWKKR